jgi:hypothetical protein
LFLFLAGQLFEFSFFAATGVRNSKKRRTTPLHYPLPPKSGQNRSPRPARRWKARMRRARASGRRRRRTALQRLPRTLLLLLPRQAQQTRRRLLLLLHLPLILLLLLLWLLTLLLMMQRLPPFQG